MVLSIPGLPKGRLSALHFAAREGQLAAVQASDLQRRRFGSWQTKKAATPALCWRSLNGHYEIAAALLNAGADVNAQDMQWPD